MSNRVRDWYCLYVSPLQASRVLQKASDGNRPPLVFWRDVSRSLSFFGAGVVSARLPSDHGWTSRFTRRHVTCSRPLTEYCLWKAAGFHEVTGRPAAGLDTWHHHSGVGCVWWVHAFHLVIIRCWFAILSPCSRYPVLYSNGWMHVSTEVVCDGRAPLHVWVGDSLSRVYGHCGGCSGIN